MDQTEKKIIEIFKSELEIDSVNMDDKFQEFDTYDSLASVVISSEIEDVFKFKLDSNRLNQMETIEEIVNLIKNNV